MLWGRGRGAALRRPPRRTGEFAYACELLQERARRLRKVADIARNIERDERGALASDRLADQCILAVRALNALERVTEHERAAGVAS
jgi:hypothetical protein